MLGKLDTLLLVVIFISIIYYQTNKIEALLESQKTLTLSLRILNDKIALLENKQFLFEMKEEAVAPATWLNSVPFDGRTILCIVGFFGAVYCGYVGVCFCYKIGTFYSTPLLTLFVPISNNRFSTIYEDTYHNIIRLDYSVLNGENKLAEVWVLDKSRNVYECVGDISKYFSDRLQETIIPEDMATILDALDNMSH